jgi:photosynthetic reaction center cytochrome c subunit
MQSQGPSERQLAIFISVGVALLTAGITIVAFWWIYQLVLIPDLADARAESQAQWSQTDGVQLITNPSEERIQEMQQTIAETESAGGNPREPWLGSEAWTAGLQAGQEYIDEFPEPQNVQILTDLNTEQIWNYMQWQMSAAMGVGCQYCHNINNYAADSYSQKISARLMLILVQDLNSEYMANLPNWRGNYVQCSTCHNGAPNNLPAVSNQFDQSVPPIPATVIPLGEEGEPQLDAAMEMSLKEASLYYLYNYQVWRPYDENDPTSRRGSLALTYPEGRTQEQVTINQNTMNLMGWSMNVGCTYCHNSRNFYAYEADTVAPQYPDTYAINRLKSQRMLLMTTFMAENWNRYVLPRDVSPESLPLDGRLYYVTIDETPYSVPGCYTCHQNNIVPPAAINAADIPEGEEGIYTFPSVLKGLAD